MSALDRTLFLLVYSPSPHAVWLWAMVAISFVGGGNALFVIVPLAFVERARVTTRRLLVAIVITAAVVFSLKHTVGRPRPYTCLAGVCAHGPRPPHDPSFPSGHAAGAACLAGFFADRKKPWRTLGLGAAALAVGLSRVVLGVHFPGDVAMGAGIGAALGVATARFGPWRGVGRGPTRRRG